MDKDGLINDKIALKAAVLLYGLGAAFSGYLVFIHVFNDAGRFCEMLQTDCLGVIQSEYGLLFGLSAASYGLGYFTFQLALIYGLSRSPTRSAIGMAYVILPFNVSAAMFSLYYTYVLKSVLYTGCAACYGVHLVNLSALCLTLTLLFRGERYGLNKLKEYLSLTKAARLTIISFQIGLIVFLGANLIETRHQLGIEQKKISENLQYYRYLYKKEAAHVFKINPEDTLIGDQDYSIHQIVLIYKDGCSHCQIAEKKLSEIVRNHDMAVHLILKNFKNISKTQLDELKVTKTPAVFINGRYAKGWEVHGFMSEFAEDCGC